ncbi:MAG: GNAT family N-acetyltransferase [Candidatus Hodarchaeales archaeon]|jgi:ribosomal protein S18 acetylase RimI-like enzyme
MIIKNLAGTSLTQISQCFNEAFSDYFFKFTATEEYLHTRWKGAGVDYNLSFGVFIENKLVGFIIHGIDKWNSRKTAFNVGTGVIPEYRGKKFVKKLYNKTIPILKNFGIEQCLLEVIQQNEKAIKAYRSVGFKEKRELISFTSNFKPDEDKNALDIQVQFKIRNDITDVDWDKMKTFQDFEPSWENSISSLMRNKEIYQFIEVFKEKKLICYAIINPKTGYIPQFAITKSDRRMGYLKCLFKYLSAISNKLSVINVDKHSRHTIEFLQKFGFKEFVSQYEMEKIL